MSTIRQRLHDRIDLVPGEHRPRPTRSGAIALTVLVLLLIVAFGGWRPWAGGGRTLRAQFATADQLVSGRTPVRIAGVKVGTVDKVQRGPGGRGAVVVMRIDDNRVHVKRDATAHIRIRTVLAGTRYVDLDPGSPVAAPLGGATIPMSATSSQVDWDDVNEILQQDIRTGQQRVLKGLRQTLADPAAIGHTLDTLGPTLSVIGSGLGAARGQQTGDLQHLVASTAKVVAATSRDRGALESLVRSGAHALGVTNDHRVALGQAVQLSPLALSSTTTTMHRLNITLGKLDPLARDLRPGARLLAPAATRLRPALDQTDRLLAAARPVLRDLPPALRNLATMSRQAVPLVGSLSPIVTRLHDELLPWLAKPDPDTKLATYEAIGPALSVLDSAAGDYDKNGWFFHFPITPTGDTVALPCGPGLTPGEIRNCKAVSSVLGKLVGTGKAGKR